MERKEAIEVVKSNWPSSGYTMLREALETLIPELKESEDERIRKMLIRIYKKADMGGEIIGEGITYKQVIAWLEKQCEQKPTWSEEDDVMVEKIIDDISPLGECPDYPTENTRKFYEECNDEIEWLKSIKQKFHWKPTEEQIRALENFVRSIGESGYASPYDNNAKLVQSLLNELKKL